MPGNSSALHHYIEYTCVHVNYVDSIPLLGVCVGEVWRWYAREIAEPVCMGGHSCVQLRLGIEQAKNRTGTLPSEL